MRCGRFAVLFFWCSLAGLLAVSLGPGSAPAAVGGAGERAEPCLGETRAGIATIDADAPISGDIAANSGSNPSAPEAWRFIGSATLSRVQRPTLSSLSDRAPPIA
jgi:uncharacterized membrane protein